ncbi:MAG: hypothetical protein AAFO58_01820 [Pseudomonadota bacterium]
MRRTVTMTAHWSLFLLAAILLAGNTPGIAGWLYVAACMAMLVPAVTLGLMNRPTPQLKGALRLAHPWLHRALYGLLAWSGAATLMLLIGGPDWDARLSWNLTIALGAAHGLFHLWRNAVLSDGARGLMTPRVVHPYL